MSTSTGTKTGILGMGVIGAALVCLGGASPGAPTASPTPTAKTAPGDLMKPVITITDVKGLGNYLDVEVMNTTPSTDEATVHFRGKATPFKPNAKGNTKVRISAEWPQYVPFCELGTHPIHLTGNATVDTRERTVAFASTWTFTATGNLANVTPSAIPPENPKPDTGTVAIVGGEVKTPYKCGSKFAAEVTVNNTTAVAAQHLHLTFKDIAGVTLAEVPFQLAAHSKRNVLVETANNVSGRADLGARYRITISDDANELGGRLAKNFEYDVLVSPQLHPAGEVTAHLE